MKKVIEFVKEDVAQFGWSAVVQFISFLVLVGCFIASVGFAISMLF